MIEVLAGERILATEKGPAYTAGPAVIDGDFLVMDDFRPRATGHGHSFAAGAMGDATGGKAASITELMYIQ
jgi:hypothetical protein